MSKMDMYCFLVALWFPCAFLKCEIYYTHFYLRGRSETLCKLCCRSWKVLNSNSLYTALPIKVIFSTHTEPGEPVSKHKDRSKCLKPGKSAVKNAKMTNNASNMSESCGNTQHLKHHFTFLLSPHLLADQDMSPVPLSGLLNSEAFTLAKALKDIFLQVLVRGKGLGNSF